MSLLLLLYGPGGPLVSPIRGRATVRDYAISSAALNDQRVVFIKSGDQATAVVVVDDPTL